MPTNNSWNSQDPAQVAKGGTGIATTTAYGVILGGTTATGAFQNAGAGTAGQILVSGGAAAVSSYKTFSVVSQVFTSSGTYTPTSGMKYCIVECVGGGGGGGGIAGNAAGFGGAAGGGGGEFGQGVFSAATIGASQTVTIGAAGAAGTAGNNAGGTGGTTSLGALLTAVGGSGGAGNAGSTVTKGSQGGAGGTGGTGGDFHAAGCPGGGGLGILGTGAVMHSGAGGASYYGGGGAGITTDANPTGAAGNAGTAFGSGGSGAEQTNNATSFAGGAGVKGFVSVIEFVIA